MALSTKRKPIDLASLIVAICVFSKLQPWFLWGASNFVTFGLFTALYLLAIVPNLSFRGKSKQFLFISFLFLLIFVCIVQGYNLLYSLSIVSLCVVPFLREDKLKAALNYFEIILAVFLGGGAIVRLLLLAGISFPSFYIAPLNEEFYMGYTAYPPFLVVNNGFTEYFRFYGPFDEPGVVGTVSLFVMFIERYNLKKWTNIAIFIGAIMSFSFMFMVGSLFYIVVSFVNKPTTAVSIILFFVSFYGVTKDVPFLQDAIYNRFEWQSDSGKFGGDKRFKDDQKKYIESIRGTSDYFFGDHGKSTGDFVGARSYLDAILKYGFIFCFLYIVWFIAYARMRRLSWYQMFIFLVFLLLNLYQRPNFISFSYIFLYSSYILFLSSFRDSKRGSLVKIK